MDVITYPLRIFIHTLFLSTHQIHPHYFYPHLSVDLCCERVPGVLVMGIDFVQEVSACGLISILAETCWQQLAIIMLTLCDILPSA